LATAVAAVTAAIATVSTFVNAAASVVSSILAPLQTAQMLTQQYMATADSLMSGVTGFGGIVAGGSPATLTVGLQDQAEYNDNYNNLINLNATLGRMSANLNGINGSPNTVTVAGSNLFQIAVEQYDDATAWTGIATANGLTDPFIQGAETLNIPLQPAQDDGVLTS
jgi:nucleoid-associated protein YgaU